MTLNNFRTKKVNSIKTAGECLKQRREGLGISIKDVSNKLKIRMDYLENLENGNYDNLPPAVYVRGFIRSYASLLGINPEGIVNVYNREMTIRSKVKRIPTTANQEIKFTKKDYAIITPKFVAIFFSLLFLSIVGYYLWHQISSFSSTPYLFVSYPPTDKVVNSPYIVVEGKTEASATLKINGENVFVDQNGHFREKITLRTGRNVLIIEALNRFNRISRKEINVIYEKKLEPVPADDKKQEGVYLDSEGEVKYNTPE